MLSQLYLLQCSQYPFFCTVFVIIARRVRARASRRREAARGQTNGGQTGNNEPPRLSDEFIASLPVCQHCNCEGSEFSQEECIVCLMEFEEDEMVKILPCGHMFHTDCIDEWLKRSTFCPLCKADPRELKPISPRRFAKMKPDPNGSATSNDSNNDSESNVMNRISSNSGSNISMSLVSDSTNMTELSEPLVSDSDSSEAFCSEGSSRPNSNRRLVIPIEAVQTATENVQSCEDGGADILEDEESSVTSHPEV